MYLLKSVLMIALVVATVSARSHSQRQRQRGRGIHQRGREFAIAEAAATPEAEQSHAALGDALDAATEQKDIFLAPENLSASEAAVAGETLMDQLTDAVAIEAQSPQAHEVQAEVVAEKVQDTHNDLGTNLNIATSIQILLITHGAEMSPEEVIKQRGALQKHLALAQHFAKQNYAAIQQNKAIEAGAGVGEVAEIAAPQTVAQQGRMNSRLYHLG